MKLCKNCQKKISFWKALKKKDIEYCDECYEKIEKEKEFDFLVQNAVNLYNSKHNTENEFNAIITYDLNTKKAFNSKAKIMELQNEFNKALEFYDKALEIEPNYTIALKNKAILLYDIGKYEEAIESFNKMLKNEPNNWEYTFYKGLLFFSQKRKKEAIELYNNQLKQEITNPEDWIYKGRILLLLKQYKESLHSLDKAVELSMNKSRALCYKAVALIELKRYIEALLILEKALDIFPENELAKKIIRTLPENVRTSPLHFQDSSGKKIELKNIKRVLKINA